MHGIASDVVCGVRMPKTLGRIGQHKLACMCEEAVEYARSKTRRYGLVLQHDGKLVMDLVDNSNTRLMVAAFVNSSNPDFLAEQVREEVTLRGLL